MLGELGIVSSSRVLQGRVDADRMFLIALIC